MRTPLTQSQTRLAKQSGVVLLVALALLVVIGFSSALILRGSIFNGLISQNIGNNLAAQQAAEIALRFCEQQVRAPAVAPNILPMPDNAADTATAWQAEASWAPGTSIAVPLNQLNGNANISNASQLNLYRQPPLCLIERLPIRDVAGQFSKRDFGFQITARGFSPDYRRASNGDIISGAEVILQSVLRLSTCSTILQQPDCP